MGLAPQEVAAYFDVKDWPNDIARFDLGGRVLDVIPTPGHEPAHIMVHDARTRLIFSGDMLYPGRLYVPRDKFDVFRASANRLAAFARAHPVRALLGAHIEMMTIAGQDYAPRATTHPDEHPLPLSPQTIFELQDAVKDAGPSFEIDRHDDFIVYPVEPRPATY